MAGISIDLDTIKSYLRVNWNDDDVIITAMMLRAEVILMDVARLSIDEYQAIISEEDSSGLFTEGVRVLYGNIIRTAFFYAVSYLYEYREDMDTGILYYHLREILGTIRERVQDE